MAKKRKKKGNKKKDKIFNNNYNQGTLEDFSDDPIVLDEGYKRTYLQTEYRMHNDFRLKELAEKVHAIVNSSKYSKIIDNKKVLKKKLHEILEYVLEALEPELDYTFTEKFFVITDMFPKVQESLIYECLPYNYKQKALRELKDYTSIDKKNQSNELF